MVSTYVRIIIVMFLSLRSYHYVRIFLKLRMFPRYQRVRRIPSGLMRKKYLEGLVTCLRKQQDSFAFRTIKLVGFTNLGCYDLKNIWDLQQEN